MTEHEGAVNILIVDDHPENLLALEAILSELGQNLVKAHTGSEALRCLLQQDFALILLDVEMPHLSGFDVAELVRARERSRSTPIIFLTAVNKSDMHVSHGYSVGAVDYLFKPFVPEILKSKVLAFVDLFKKTQEVRQQSRMLLDQNQKLSDAYRELEIKNRELRIERDFTTAVLETAASLIMVQNPQGHIVRFNKACEKLTGYSSEEVRSHRPWDLFVEENDQEIVADDFHLTASQPRVLHENYWITKAGERRLISWSTTAVLGNEGEVDYVIATGMDVTDRRHAEEQRVQYVLEQAARAEAEAVAQRTAFLADASTVLASTLDYETTLTSIPRLVVPAIADWCLVCISQADEAHFRVEVRQADSTKEEVARMLREFQPSAVHRHSPWMEVLLTGNSVLIEKLSDSVLESFAQDPRYLELLRQIGIKSMVAAPLQSRGRVVGALTLFTAESGRHFKTVDVPLVEDLARRAAMTLDNTGLYLESLNANHAKDEFLAMVSHELRTPLNSILGWARLLHSGRLDPANTQRGLETIERNVKAQVQLIEDLLDVSRIIMGKLRLNLKPTEMTPIIEAALDAVRPMAELKEITVESKLDISAGTISGDPDRLQQVIWNLLSNAIKFTPKQGRVEISLQRINSHVELRVRDTGKGVNADFLPYVFERFRQGTTGITRSHGGLGLGLAIVRHLTELHGGAVSAESDGEGKGSTFIVNLPIRAIVLKNEDDEGEGAPLKNPSWKAKLLDGASVMIVDDEADARELVGMVMEQNGAQVILARSVSEALASLDEQLPDVLICDIGMPEEDGYSLIAKLRKREPEQGGAVPAIALTAFSMPEDRQRILQSGFQMYVGKPVEPSDLVAAVARFASKLTVGARAQK